MSLNSFLCTVKWFQVLLYNCPNLTFVICMHTDCSIWPIDRIQSVTSTPGLRGPGSNGNERVLYIPQIFKAGALPSDGHIPDTHWEGFIPLCRDAVGVFYCHNQLGCTYFLNKDWEVSFLTNLKYYFSGFVSLLLLIVALNFSYLSLVMKFGCCNSQCLTFKAVWFGKQLSGRNQFIILWTCSIYPYYTVWNRTVFLHKNGFGIKYPTKVDMP